MGKSRKKKNNSNDIENSEISQDFNETNYNEFLKSEACSDNKDDKELKFDFKENNNGTDTENVAVEEKPKKINNIKYTLAFLLFNVIVVIILLLIEKRKNQSIERLSDIINSPQTLLYLFYAFLMVVITVTCETLSNTILIYKADGGFRPILSFKNSVLGKLYEVITPMSIGSQPYQMYYLAKNKIKGTSAMSIPLVKLTVFIITSNIVIILALLSIKTEVSIGIIIAASIGIFFNLLFPLLILLFIINKKLAIKITEFGVKLGVKLHLIKNYNEKIDKINKKIHDFVSSLRYLASNPPIFITIIIISIIEISAIASIPFFIIKSFNGNIGFFDSFVKILYVMKGGSLIPTPSSAGGAEYIFYKLFEGSVEQDRFFFTLILWRIFYTYIYMILGIVISLYDAIKDVILNKKRKITKNI